MVCRIFHGHSAWWTYYGYHYFCGRLHQGVFQQGRCTYQILGALCICQRSRPPCREVFKEILSTCVGNSNALPIKEVLEAMCLTVYPAPLPDGIFGRTYFNSATVDIYKNHNSVEIISAEIEEGTILVSPDSFFMRNIGCTHNTIIHECVHWDKHYKFFELQKLINPELTSISCKVVEQYKKGKDDCQTSWSGWNGRQALLRLRF